MNGYELHANAYRDVLKREGDTLQQEVKASIEKEIKVLDIMVRVVRELHI